MKKRFFAFFFALMLASVGALSEGEIYEVDPDTGEILFLADPEETVELDEIAQDAFGLVDGQMNILLLGIDARPGEESGRTDTMILMTLDSQERSVKLTSFMRDLYVEIPGRKNNRLNAAYRFGGADLLFETLEENFGVEVDRYVTVNFTMMADLVNQIGGLELNVESDYIRDRINAVIKMDNKALGIDIDTDLLNSCGLQTLNGKQVQAYARWRTGSSDFERTQRQRQVIIAILEKLKNEFSMMQLMRLAATNIDNVYTNMSAADIMGLVPALFEVDIDSIEELRIPVDGGYKSQTVSGMAVLVPDRDKNIQALNAFLAE